MENCVGNFMARESKVQLRYDVVIKTKLGN